MISYRFKLALLLSILAGSLVSCGRTIDESPKYKHKFDDKCEDKLEIKCVDKCEDKCEDDKPKRKILCVIGPPGAKGQKGLTGKPGAQGHTGSQGSTGNQGPNGNPGNDGLDGIDGPKGLHGPIGNPGPQGDEGAPGAPAGSALIGPDGAPGLDGPQGNTGNQGPNGYKCTHVGPDHITKNSYKPIICWEHSDNLFHNIDSEININLKDRRAVVYCAANGGIKVPPSCKADFLLNFVYTKNGVDNFFTNETFNTFTYGAAYMASYDCNLYTPIGMTQAKDLDVKYDYILSFWGRGNCGTKIVDLGIQCMMFDY